MFQVCLTVSIVSSDPFLFRFKRVSPVGQDLLTGPYVPMHLLPGKCGANFSKEVVGVDSRQSVVMDFSIAPST